MPTATTTSAKPRAKAARKAPRANRAKAAARRSSATKAKATRAKAAAPAPVDRVAGRAARQARNATRETAGVFGDYAERAVLIPVGAALIARDRVVSSVNDTISSYSSTHQGPGPAAYASSVAASTARNRLEREVRKARVRVERELRQRRAEIETHGERHGQRHRRSPRAIAKNGSELANRVPELANPVQERILSLV